MLALSAWLGGAIKPKARKNTGKIMAVSLANKAARHAPAEASNHQTEGSARALRMALRRFLVDRAREDWLIPIQLKYRRNRSTVARTATDMSGSGTVTHATDSVCAGCSAKSPAASNAATGSRNSAQTVIPRRPATETCFTILRKCHPAEDTPARMKLIRNHKINSGR